MLQNHYRNLAITFFISTLWCIYVFFDYYQDRSFLRGLTLLADYIYSLIGVNCVSAGMLVLRFTKYKAVVLKSFLYTFAAAGNLFLSFMYMVYLVFSNNVKEFFTSFGLLDFFSVIAFFLGLGFLIDIYKNHVFKLYKK